MTIRATLEANSERTNISFPCTEKRLEEEKLNISADTTNVFVQSITSPKQLNMLSNKVLNLDELNYLAKRLDSFSEVEVNKFFAAANDMMFDDLKDLINLTFNLNQFALLTDVSSFLEIGREYVLQTEGAIPAIDENNPKYEEIGRKVINTANGVMTEHGLLLSDSNEPMKEYYNGTVFPPFDYYGNALLSAEIEYKGNTETLYLPAEDKAIDKTVDRLGADSLDDCVIGLDTENADFDRFSEKVETVINTEGLKTANRMLLQLSESYAQWDKLNAAIEFTGAKTSKDILLLNGISKDFVFVSDVNNSTDIAYYFESNYDDYHINSELMEFFDFEAFGKYLTNSHEGGFTDDGYVYYAGNIPLKSITSQFGKLDNEVATGGDNMVNADFYCPLVGCIFDSEENGEYEVTADYLRNYAIDIKDALDKYNALDENGMETYFDEDDGIKEKLISVRWNVEPYNGMLLGKIECVLKEPLTVRETEILKDWITGQNSDGFGEGFEQREISTDEGELYVSFWNSSGRYFLCGKDELDGYIHNQKNVNERIEATMNDYDRLKIQAKLNKQEYPQGTRIMLLKMGDDHNPIPPNVKGTVRLVDDIGTIHCVFDNGRELGIVPGEDSFRKLTQEELLQEQQSQDFAEPDEQNEPLMNM